MRHINLAIVIFVISLLIMGPNFTYVYASAHDDCSCCANKCQEAKACHQTTNVCSCSYQSTNQVYFIKDAIFASLPFSGLLIQKSESIYLNPFPSNIFHPPKA